MSFHIDTHTDIVTLQAGSLINLVHKKIIAIHYTDNIAKRVHMSQYTKAVKTGRKV